MSESVCVRLDRFSMKIHPALSDGTQACSLTFKVVQSLDVSQDEESTLQLYKTMLSNDDKHAVIRYQACSLSFKVVQPLNIS